jgi:hypothetical protein
MVFTTIYRTAGALVAVGALLMVIGVLLHARPNPALEEMMVTIAEGVTRWRLSHSLILFGSIFLAMGSLIITAGRTRLTDRWGTLVGWAGLVIALPIFAVVIAAELSVFPLLATAGDLPAFARWYAFAVTGIVDSAAFLFLAVFFIASDQFQRDDRLTQRWPAGLGALAALVAAVGAVLLGILDWHALLPMVPGGFLLTLPWLFWFGIGLCRSEDA